MATATITEPAVERGCWPAREAVDEKLREARRVATTARHAAEDAAAEATLNIRRHPLRAVAGAFVVAGFVGLLVGFGTGWFARART